MTSPFQIRFLRDDQHGGDVAQLQQVADAIAAFIGAAQSSIDLAIYDFRLDDPTATATVVGAFTAAAERGVTVRIGYDAGKPSTEAIEADATRDPEDDGAGDAAAGETFADAAALAFAAVGGDPAPPGTPQWITSHFQNTKVQTRAIHAGSQLMHSKFLIRDAPTTTNPPAPATTRSAADPPASAGSAAVWTGSTNFTDDAWTRQENNIITIADAELAAGYLVDFDQMWAASAITGAGKDDAGHTTVAGADLGWDFCPGDGAAVNTALAARITAATTRLIVGSMVLTSHEVLSALAGALRRRLPVSGIYDAGQMGPIVAQWKTNPNDTAVLADWTALSAVLVGKASTPYSPTGPHDFMHLKVLVADDTVTTGSYNFSANAERNAENQLHTTDPATVSAYADYLTAVVAAYS